MEEKQPYNVHATVQHQRSNAGRIFGGLIVLTVGILLLAREAGYLLPPWLFTWQMLLITIGLFIGVRSSFRGWAWLILITIGLFFFMDDYIENLRLKNYFWPALIIAAGLLMIFRSRRISYRNNIYHAVETGEANAAFSSDNDYIDNTTIFSGLRRNIVSKNFKGGEAVTIFGGTELNFANAGITGTSTLELTQIFAGAKLVVPPDWNIITDEMVNILGGINDKRSNGSHMPGSPDKTLRLKGTCIFGGIEIVSS